MLLFEIFQDVPDPRTPHPWLKHSLMDVLCIGLCAVVSGGEGFVHMADYGVAKEAWLRERLELELANGIPSHDIRPGGTRTASSRLSIRAPSRCASWLGRSKYTTRRNETQGDVLAIDGKSLRRSFDTATGQGALHLVSVWACEARLVLAQQAVNKESNAMTAVPLLLEMLDLKGCVVTTDALNTQKNIAEKVQERGGDYVLALKENHRHLFEDVRDTFAWCQKQPQGLARLCEDEAATHEWEHGRREVRRCFCL